MNKETRVFVSGDYAGIEVDDIEMYFGYEFQYIMKMDIDEESEDDVETWGFALKKDGKVIFSADATEIGGDKFECQEMLIKGMVLAMKSGALYTALGGRE